MGFAVVAAFALDMLLGDPEDYPHPVRWIGRFISAQENLYRWFFKSELAGGALLIVVTTAAVYLASFLLVFTAGAVSPTLGFLAHVALIYYSISVKSLGSAATDVKNALDSGDIENARKLLSKIVGRDTKNMDRSAIVRATVETVAENSVDGFIGPLFFALLGGGPLAFAYRAVNCCDSMVGYKNLKYEKFGKFSARADDIANFIPARISMLLISTAAFTLNMDAKRCLSIGWRDRLKHSSPNAGHPEAVFAGALGIQLGGTGYYNGEPSEKPLIGDSIEEASIAHIAQAVQLLRVTALVTCAIFLLP